MSWFVDKISQITSFLSGSQNGQSGGRAVSLVGLQYWESGGPPYVTVDVNKELRQGEIISGLKYYHIRPNADDPSQLDVFAELISYALVGTPDCDLLQHFRRPSNKIMGVLLFVLEELQVAKDRTGGNSAQWKWVRENQVAQFYRLGKIAVEHDVLGNGIPDLVVDFKRYFTLTAEEIYRQCRIPDGARRRCRLNDIWREDFRQRALSYMGRIAVPDEGDYE